MTAHSKLFSPSSSERWLTCTESPYLNLVDRGSSSYADEGSAAHKLGELCLRHGHKAADYVGKQIDVFDDGSLMWEVDEDMAYYVQDYADYCMEQVDPLGSYHVETRFDLTHIAEGMFGTGDFCAVSDEELVIVDLKYGKGLKVDGVDNSQLKLYALGAMNDFEWMHSFEKVRTVVIQPRLEWLSEDTYTTTELLDFEDSVRHVCDQIINKRNLVRVASEKGCKWCAANKTCGTFAEMATWEAKEAFKDVGFEPTPPELSPEDRSKALQSIPLLKAWIKATEEGALSDIERGIEIPGWKVVEGRSFRKFSDPETVMNLCKRSRSVKEDDYLKKELLTVAQLEKALKSSPKLWKRINEHVIKPTGKNTLVPESDKRPPVETVADGFKDIQ